MNSDLDRLIHLAAIIAMLLALIAIAVALLILFTKIKAPWLMAACAACPRHYAG